MKILLSSDSNSSHTIKWATEKDIDIILFNFAENVTDIYKKYKNIILETAEIPVIKQFGKEAHFSKLIYLKSIPIVKRMIKKYKPDILHSHYASSYGLIGALFNFHPFIITVWGSDVFNFPNRSFVHRKMFKYNLSKSDKILSTNNFMAKEIAKYSKKPVEITPFGVDLKNINQLGLNQSFYMEILQLEQLKV